MDIDDEFDPTDLIYENLKKVTIPGETYELRALDTKRGTVSGYFDDMSLMAKAAARWEDEAMGVYMTLNPTVPDLIARCANKAVLKPKATTSDSDILARRMMLIDFDPVRKSGISSTDEEHELAIERAQRVGTYLSRKGWTYILTDSGNGAHLLVPIDLPNDLESAALVKGVLQFLAFKFDDEAIKVDLTTFNAGRITKIPGTLAQKGSHTALRPHRRSGILKVVGS